MSPPNGDPRSNTDSQARLALQIATRALLDHSDERWVEIAEDVLDKVLARAHPSHPVRAEEDSLTFHVSEQVLARHVLDAIDPLPDVEVDAVRIHADRDHYTGITIVITARYGVSLLSASDTVAEAANARLMQILGDAVPPLSVSTMHVHVEDVTVDDPGSGSDS